ncbi:leucine-rich repeat-containing protein 15-like [Stegodyphus dumicola]|uniref:leucine-rich repeat-containing protein 15-like n=1 Tax=Stegodyphus dumicola TaxID=202533 RepID=UPI0015A905C7|nr:leucine-rich repeat-containing protein 15-like [Stegodyphus dumicola]
MLVDSKTTETMKTFAMLLSWIFSFILLNVKDVSSTSVPCPSSCYCDATGDYVSCVGDGLWRFPLDIPPTTKRLELRNFLTTEISSQDFSSLTELQELKLQQSRIETVENSTFVSNTKLEKLDLSQNSLAVLCYSVFKDLRRLRLLDLSSNFVEFIEEAFVELLNLEQLNIRDNKLSQLTTRTFVGLHKVQYLNLDANNISAIEVGTFQYLTNLAHLIISNNPLTTLSRLDFFGSRLQYIDISHVGLDRIPQSLTKFVRDLRLAKNNLTHISAGDFDSYPYLGLLVLDDNCVSEIENDALGRQEYLMRLWLNGNCLTKVPPNLPPSLLALYMEENKLTDLPSYSFKGLTQLEQLFLQRNEIRNLSPCVFCDLISLKNLDLQANQIENLTSGVFANLTQLQTLDLSQNNLKIIDARCFDSLSKLTTLQMSRVPTNVQLDEAMFDALHSLLNLEVYDSSLLVQTIVNSTRMLHGLRNVQELNIMHNRIIKLRSDFPSFFPALKVIKMSGNLWQCDKDIKWLSNWIRQSNVQFYSSYNIRCATPQNIQLKPLMMLTDTDFETSTIELEATVSTETTSVIVSVKSTEIVNESTVLFSSSVTTTLSSYKSMKKEMSYEETITPSDVASHITNALEPNSMSADPYKYEIVNNEENSQIPAYLTSVTPESYSPTSSLLEMLSTTSAEDTTVSPTQPHYLTPENTHTSEVSVSLTSTTMKTFSEFSELSDVSNSSDDFRNNSVQTVSPQRRVLSSRLRVVTVTGEQSGWDHTTTIAVSAGLAGGCFLLLAGVLTAFTVFRLRHRYQPVKHRNMRRSSSISYYPQKDEVSIVTLTEGTVGLRTNSHHGLGNKLYYIMENGGGSADPNRDALPDPQLQELLPHSTTENCRVY